MFGSNDDKKAPAEAGEKRGLFGWFRKKQPASKAEAQPEAAESASVPGEEQAPPEPETLAPVQHEALPETMPAPETVEAPVAAEAPSEVESVAEEAEPETQKDEKGEKPKRGFFARLLGGESAPVAELAPEAEVATEEAKPTEEVEEVEAVGEVEPDAEPVEALQAVEEPAVAEASTPEEEAAPVQETAKADGKRGFFARLLGGESAPVAEPSPEAEASTEEAKPTEEVKAVGEVESVAEPVEALQAVEEPAAAEASIPAEAAAAVQKPAKGNGKPGFFARLKQGLAKTSASLGEGMASLFLGKKAIDDELLEELETRLLTADVGVEATTAIIQSLTRRVARKELADSDALYKALQEELAGMLRPVEQPLVIDSQHQPYVILVVGVNGVGKTTTIGKLAKKLQLEGKKVMLAAGDTFRAAAVEQLQVWGERNNISVIAQHTGADSASVIYDAVQAAKARGIDVLIADTAGRLHTKDNLMEELKKVRRVIGKLDETAPHEVLLVLDAGTGQNAISQTRQFNQAVELSGLALTKLDGTAKGGVIFALAKQFGLPIRYIGVGEGIDDLREFAAEEFVSALFAEK